MAYQKKKEEKKNCGAQRTLKLRRGCWRWRRRHTELWLPCVRLGLTAASIH